MVSLQVDVSMCHSDNHTSAESLAFSRVWTIELVGFY